MPDQDDHIDLFDFTGGLNTFYPEFQVAPNQSIALDNINLFDKGFEKRRGDAAFNGTAMVSGSTAIQGIGYMKFTSGTDFLNAVAGTKFFTSSSLSGTMADKTGGLTITSGQNNLWHPVSFNDLQIWFGGAPDAPFAHDGTGGNAAALGGSPPIAYSAFVANNRVFAMGTSANPSILQWSVLSDPEDWTGTGSGNQQVSLDDGDSLLAGIPIGNNIAVLFKETSTHRVLLDTAPFPVIQLQKGTGIAGRFAYAVVDGVIYFVTPSKRMKATTDGISFVDFPNYIDDVWDSINSSRVEYIQGIYYEKIKQIHWYVSTGTSTTNDLAIIWDVRHKCWLRHTTGFTANVVTIAQNLTLYTGQYDGTIYQKDVASTYTDASDGDIDAYWQSFWAPPKGLSAVIHPRWIDHVIESQSAGSFICSYGFDYSPNQKQDSHSMVAPGDKWDEFLWDVGSWGGKTSIERRTYVYGRGNTFNFKVGNSNTGQAFVYQGATIYLRPVQTRKKLLAV